MIEKINVDLKHNVEFYKAPSVVEYIKYNIYMNDLVHQKYSMDRRLIGKQVNSLPVACSGYWSYFVIFLLTN